MGSGPGRGLLIALAGWGVGTVCAFGQTVAPAETAAAALREGQAAFSRHDLAAAQAGFAKAVRVAPHDEAALAALGMVLLQQGKTAEAVPPLEAAHALHKADLSVEANLALAYVQLGEADKALPLFADAIAGAKARKQPVPVSLREAYARALAGAGRLPQAVSEMQAAVNVEPKNAGLHGELGSLYAQAAEWQRAESEFRTEVALQPEAAMGHLRMGLAMQAQSETGALQEFARAAQLAPGEAPILLAWGTALAAAGEDAKAVPVLERVLASQPENAPAMNALGQAYQRMGRVPEAVELFRKALLESPDDAVALTNLGMAYAQMQRAKDAVPLLQRAVAIDPKSVTAHQDLAAAYVQLSQFADAAAELKIAIGLEPESPQLHYDLGLALKNQDDAAGAIPELQKAETLDAAGPEAPYLLGVLYMQAGRYPEAARELETSLRLRPENGDGWAVLGSVDSKLDKLPEAVAALRKAIEQMPRQPDPHLTLAAVLVKQGQTTEAAEQRKEAATLMRSNMNRQRAEVATNAGQASLKSGDLAGAMQQFQDAVSYDAGYAEAHGGLADVLARQGKTVEAAAERQKAAELSAAANQVTQH